ncbi:MAG: thiamine pyrophosphate-dependent enzyme [Variovorax sp.]
MKYLECFKFLAAKRTDQLVVTSAGNSGQAWWAATRETELAFYLDASMSLSTMFASGMAAALPQTRFWAFMGDGAFCMNPGMLMVERQMNLPNLTHFLVSNRAYGATSNAALPNGPANDYAAIARAVGLERVFEFHSISEMKRDFDEAIMINAPGHTFVVLEVEPFSDAEQKLDQPPFDAPELKYRFGRAVEKLTGADVFGYRLLEATTKEVP